MPRLPLECAPAGVRLCGQVGTDRAGLTAVNIPMREPILQVYEEQVIELRMGDTHG